MERVIGIDYLLVGRSTMSGVENLFVGISDKWDEVYRDNNFITVDPIISESLNGDTPFLWGERDFSKARKEEKEFLDLSRSYGLVNGVSFGKLKRGEFSKSAISTLGFGCENVDKKQKIIAARYSSILTDLIFDKGVWKKPCLSKREVEVLSWCSCGKSYWDISKILNISERTVKFHMNNICKKLCVVSKTQAVAVGVSLSLIDM